MLPFHALLAAALAAPLLAADPAPAAPVEFRWTKDRVVTITRDGHSDSVMALAFSPDGKTLLSGSSDGTLRLWDVATKKTRLTIDAESPVLKALFSPDGATLLSSGRDGFARLWDAKTGRARGAVNAGSFGAEHAGFSADGSRFFIAFLDDIRAFDTATLSATGRHINVSLDLTPIGGRHALANCIALSPDGRRYAGYGDGALAVFDMETGAIVASWKDGVERYNCHLAFSADGTKLVSTTAKRARLWDIASKKLLRKFSYEGEKWDSIGHATLSPDGRLLLAAIGGGTIVWDAATAEEIKRVSDYAWQQVFSPDGKLAVLSNPRGEILSLDAATWEKKTFSPGAAIEGISISTAANGAESFSGAGETRYTQAESDAIYAGEKLCWQGPEHGFELLASCLKAIRTAHNQGAEPEPTAPVLTQNPYESSAAFSTRVAEAKTAYEKALAERADRLNAFQIPEHALPSLFRTIFGAPQVTRTAYDPDARIFAVDVTPSSPLHAAGSFKLRLALRDEIPNDQAADFERKLSTADPVVTFLFADGKFSLDSVKLLIGERAYVALPADAAATRTLAQADIGAQAARPAAPAAGPDVAFGYAENPELAAKERELNEQRRKHADAEKLAELEGQIAALKTASAPAYHSDVDEPVAARAEDPDAYAIVVGVEAYQLADLPPARFAERDARAVAERLRALGVPPRNMKVLIGSDATRAKLAGVLEEWLPARAKAGSKIYLYFSGHGAPDAARGDAYLVPWDGDPSLLKQTGYALKSLYADLQRVPAARRVAVLDACFSGAGGRSLLAKGARPLALVRDESGGDVTVLAAASASQITAVSEAQGHGLFTYQFLKALGAGGRTAAQVFAELKPRVEDDAAGQSREQTPVLSGPDATIP